MQSSFARRSVRRLCFLFLSSSHYNCIRSKSKSTHLLFPPFAITPLSQFDYPKATRVGVGPSLFGTRSDRLWTWMPWPTLVTSSNFPLPFLFLPPLLIASLQDRLGGEGRDPISKSEWNSGSASAPLGPRKHRACSWNSLRPSASSATAVSLHRLMTRDDMMKCLSCSNLRSNKIKAIPPLGRCKELRVL